MASWTDIPNADIAQDKPIKAETGLALRDNVTAAMEGASGAPPLLEAAIGDWYSTYGGIGTYVFARGPSSDVAAGATTSGSNLLPTSAICGITSANTNMDVGNFNLSSTLSGTWQCMGTYDYTSDFASGSNTANVLGATLWQRIA